MQLPMQSVPISTKVVSSNPAHGEVVFNATFNNISVIQWNLSNPKHQGTMEMCRIVQDVGKLRCRIAQVPLYHDGQYYWWKVIRLKKKERNMHL
jgi:hypothetical protein